MKKLDIADVLAEGHRRSISFNDRRQEHLSKVRDGLTKTAYEKMDEKFKDTIRMVEMRDVVRSFGPLFKDMGIDITDKDVRSTYFFNQVSGNPNYAMKNLWKTYHGAMEGLRNMRNGYESQANRASDSMGIDAIKRRAATDASRWASKIFTRPDFSWTVSTERGDIQLEATVKLSPEGKVLCPMKNATAWHYAETDYVTLYMPITWARQMNTLGICCIDNRIIRSAHYIGDFNGVDGYRTTFYKKGLRADQWTLDEGYIGHIAGEYKLCSSTVRLASVAKRKASDKFMRDLMAAV